MIQSLLDTVKAQREFMERLPSMDVLLKKPEHSGWNGAQCIQHMNLATELYLDQIEQRLPQLKPSRGPYKPRFLADKFIQGLAPDTDNRLRYRMKTFKTFEPGEVDPKEAVDRLINNFDRLNKIIIQCEGKDMRSFKVTTALGPVLRFYVGDALRFVTAHNARHFVQLEGILSNVKHPKLPS
jgi:hypothetical protein